MKRKLPFIVLLLLVTMSLAGCVDGNPGTGKSTTQLYTVSGVIYNQSKYPVRATVNLGGREIATGKDGVYQFDDVPKGNYELSVTPISESLEEHRSLISVTEDTIIEPRLKFIIPDDMGQYDFFVYNLVNRSGAYARISARLTGRDETLAPGQTLKLTGEPGEYSFMFSTGSGWRETKIWLYAPVTQGEITTTFIYTK